MGLATPWHKPQRVISAVFYFNSIRTGQGVNFDILYFMIWSFAIINGRLAEIFFERKKGKFSIDAHCYVKESEYKTKKEKGWIQRDTQKNQFTYRKGKYLPKTKTA